MPELLGQRGRLLRIEREERHQVRAAVAHHHRLRDPAALLQPVLQVGGRDVLAARGDDDVLLATGDVEEAVLVEPAEVPGVEPAVLERLAGGGLVLVVALEDVRALDQHLAVLGDPHLHAVERPAHRAEPEAVAGRCGSPWRWWRSRSCRIPPSPARRTRRRSGGSRRRSAPRRSRTPGSGRRTGRARSCRAPRRPRRTRSRARRAPPRRPPAPCAPSRPAPPPGRAARGRGPPRWPSCRSSRRSAAPTGSSVGLTCGQVGDDLLRVARPVGEGRRPGRTPRTGSGSRRRAPAGGRGTRSRRLRARCSSRRHR